MRALLPVGCSLLVWALSACSLQMNVPAGFLRLTGREHGDLRAVTADDARIWVRDFAVDDDATVEFWAASFADELKARGYQLEEKGEIQDGDGRRGRAFAGTTTVGGEACRYFAAVFLLPRGFLGDLFSSDHGRIAEFAAAEPLFAQHLDAVKAAVATLR